MNTNRISAVAAAVTGARHLRTARNGQDAAGFWTGHRAAGADDVGATDRCAADLAPRRVPLGVIVVCDGCGSGASSEVGARLGAQLVIAALAPRLEAGACPSDPRLWSAVRAEVTGVLARLVEALPGDREQVIHEQLLFTIVAAAVAGDEIGVWAIGDGTYAIAGAGIPTAPPRVLGPFADNRPPYLAYDLLDAPAPAYLEIARATRGTLIVATDGVAELGLETITSGEAGLARYLRHPDALRRQLAVLARSTERVDWVERRTIRTPALLQDDGALAVLRWSAEVSS